MLTNITREALISTLREEYWRGATDNFDPGVQMERCRVEAGRYTEARLHAMDTLIATSARRETIRRIAEQFGILEHVTGESNDRAGGRIVAGRSYG